MVDTASYRRRADILCPDQSSERLVNELADEIDRLRTACPPLMGIKEASTHLNMTQQAVRDAWYRSRDGYSNSLMSRRRRAVMFPLPVQMLACGPVWLASQIEQYKRDKEANGQ